MFGDFDAKAKGDDERGRRTVSLVLAGALFVGIAAALAAAIATTQAVIERREREVAVEFASIEEAAPEPEPPPPPPPPPPAERRPPRARPAAVVDGPPTSIPNERAAEAEGDLADPGDVGPVGTEDGVEGGTAPAPRVTPPPAPPAPPPGPPRPPPRPPEQERIEIAPPRMLSGCSVPERPDALEGATAETITIYVRLVIGPDGRVLRARIETSHPLIPDETILACVQTRMFEPAHLPDGTAVPYPLRYAFTFRPDVL